MSLYSVPGSTWRCRTQLSQWWMPPRRPSLRSRQPKSSLKRARSDAHELQSWPSLPSHWPIARDCLVAVVWYGVVAVRCAGWLRTLVVKSSGTRQRSARRRHTHGAATQSAQRSLQQQVQRAGAGCMLTRSLPWLGVEVTAQINQIQQAYLYLMAEIWLSMPHSSEPRTMRKVPFSPQYLFHELATVQYGVPLSTPQPMMRMAWPPR
mmetsp:Transcript_19951/g.63459  ORF Transcript_19951/g.63459 Transcript_19951/m.63459 type:complete len:207 (-) Transcript_19951:650-1270(-)